MKKAPACAMQPEPQLVEKVRLTPSIYAKLSKSGGNRTISPTFDRLRAG